MNLLSFNIHGCDSSLKRRRVGKIITEGKINFYLIQETKIKVFNDKLGRCIWGNGDYDWSASGSVGQYWGLLLIWKKILLCPLFTFKGKGYLGVHGQWKGTNCFIVNIYSSCSIVDKRLLWSELLNLKSSMPLGEWLIGGDFNAVKTTSERMGRGRPNFVEMEELSYFIDAIGLIDLLVVGNMFTSFNSSGKCRSRLDRILLSDYLIRRWKVVAQKVDDKDVLDHRLVWLYSNNANWEPKTFKLSLIIQSF
ncbi:unnamed protein product [Lathyrus sativus]|nr:unnamed protein product [Lathyrus sativus]